MAKKKKKLQCSIDSNDIHVLRNSSVQDFINDFCGGEIEIRDVKKSAELINVNKDINQKKLKIFMDQKQNNEIVIPSSWLAEELRKHAIKAFPRKNMNIDINFAKKLNINRGTLSTYKNGSRPIISLLTLINIKKTVLGKKKSETGISKWINEKEINEILLNYLGLTGELELISCLRLDKKIKDLYNTRDLIYDLLYGTELFENELSLKLGQGKRFIVHIKQKITNINDQSFDPDYKFSKELLNSFRANINTNLKQKATQLIDYINRYEALNPDLKLYRKQQHNVINSDFFFIIDTLEKAYWFGFLCADGSILYVTPESGKRVRYRVYIQISYKDKAQLVKFCDAIGYDSTKISERYTNLHYKNKIKQFKSVVVQFVCKEMVEDLVNKDFASSNADYKTLPSFLKRNKNLLLAFILGYFDGDGTKSRRGGGLIYCSNEPFLKEILDTVKSLIGIELNVSLTRNKDEILQSPNFCIKEGTEDGYTIKLTKNAYKLTVRSLLYKMMMINYKNSMKRKRIDYQKNSLSLSELKHKLNSKEVLNSLITHFPISKISSYFGVEVKTIESLCIDWNIERF